MLSKFHRLPSFEISRVMRQGKRVVGKDIALLYRFKIKDLGFKNVLQENSRFAFIVSTKVDKRAVVRNRIKRLMSESVRHCMPLIKKPIDGVVIGSRALVEATQIEVEKRVREMLSK